MAESEQKLKSFFLKEKGESENLTWKLNFQKNKIMSSSTITSWKIDKEKVEALTDFIFLGFKITADDDCSHEIKSHLLLRRKVIAIQTVY